MKMLLALAVTLSVVLMVSSAPAEQVCAQHEVFMECGTSCPEHCPAFNARGELETAPLICNKMCNRGCFCATGYVKDLKRNGACVQKSLCTAP